MATVNSLVCWGGSLGKSVTVSSSTDYVTLTNHGLRNGKGVQFVSGTLPTVAGTALALNTTYYAKYISGSTFELYYDSGLTSKIDFTSTGTSLVLKGEYYQGLTDKSRWTTDSVERIYDGIKSWNTARSGATTGFDAEVCEIGEAFSDSIGATTLTLRPGSAPDVLITPTINGVPTGAHHGGVFGEGYSFTSYSVTAGNYVTVEGITFLANSPTQLGSIFILTGALLSNVFRCFFYGGNKSYCYGIDTGSTTIKCHVNGNVILAVSQGIINYGCSQSVFANNIVAKCTTGFVNFGNSTKYRLGYWYNNISIGNTTNWGTEPGSLEGAGYNIGESGDTAWGDSSGTNKTASTTDFVDFDNNDFRPASSSSPQVDAGISYYGIPDTDIAGAEVPNYNNGGAEGIDIGCYEYDHGFGNHPASTTVTFLGVVAGSEIHVYDSEDNDLVGTESCTANQSLTWGIPTNPNVKITIIKRGLRWMKFTYLSEEGPQMIPIFPQPDLGYNNPA